MTSNFFAALDDSDDDGPTRVKVPTETVKTKKAVTQAATIIEPSKHEDGKRPQGNDRNTKFGRGGRGPPREGKREYDRRSGTGRGREIKKDGGGAHNWGSDKNEASEGRIASSQAYGEEPVVEEESPAEVSPGDSDVPIFDEAGVEAQAEAEPQPEPVDNTMSYEEYMLKKKEKESSGVLAPVKTRDFVDEEFRNAIPKKAVEEDFLVMGGAKQKRIRDKKAADAAAMSTAAAELLSFRVATDFDRRGGGRGKGRGRDGGRQREGGRGRDLSFGARDSGRSDRPTNERDGLRGVIQETFAGRDGQESGRKAGREGYRGGRAAYHGGRTDGFRGGREGVRGGRGRGGRVRGGAELNVNDETTFPSLG